MKTTPPKEDEIEKAMQLLAEDRAQKVELCMQEIQAALDKYGFDLAISNPSISLVPRSVQKA